MPGLSVVCNDWVYYVCAASYGAGAGSPGAAPARAQICENFGPHQESRYLQLSILAWASE